MNDDQFREDRRSISVGGNVTDSALIDRNESCVL